MKDNNPNFDFYSFNQQNEPVESAPADEPTVLTEPVVWSTEQGGEASAAVPAIDMAEQKDKMRRGYSHLGWAFVAITFSWVFLTLVLQVIASLFAPHLLDTYWFNIVSGTLPLYVISTPLLYLIVQGTKCHEIEKKKLPISHFFILLVIAEAIMVAGSLIGNGLMGIMSFLTENDYQNQLEEAFDIPLALSFVLTVILAPVFEELIFRKLLLDRMLPYGELCAILINGLLFGAFHGNFFQFFYAAALGMLLSFLYAKTGKIHHCIVLHMCVNFLGGILPTLIYDWLGYDEMLLLMENEEALMQYISDHILPYMASMAYAALQYGCAIAGVIVFIVNCKKLKLKKAESELPAGKGLGAAFSNVGMIAALLVCAGMFAMSLAV